MTAISRVDTVTPQFINELNANFATLDAAQVTTFAQLKAAPLNAPAVINCACGFVLEDGRGGQFAFDESDTTTPGDDALVLLDSRGRRWKRVITDGVYRLSWWGPDKVGIIDCAQKVRDWYTAFATARVEGHAEAGRYRCDTAVFIDLGLVQQGTRMTGAGMYNTIFDVRNVPTSPQWLFYAGGGSPSAPAEANYWYIASFSISGNIGGSGIAVQWGTDDASDAINSAMVANVWMANSNTAKSPTAVGVRHNNTVRCIFDNIVEACGTEILTRTVSGAANNGSGKVRLTLDDTTTLVGNMVVTVAGIVGTTEANGTQTILAVVDGTHVDLDVAYSNAYVSGGTFTAYKGWGIAQQLRHSAFCDFSGAFGPAGTGVHITGGAPYGNIWRNPTIEMVDDAIKQDVATGPNSFFGGQYAVYGGGYLVSNTGAGSSGYLLIENPNNGSPATNLYASTGKGVDPAGYYMVHIRGYYGDGPQLIGVGASPFTWINKTGQVQQVITSGGVVSTIEYKGPNAGSVFANTYATSGAILVPPGAALKWTHGGAPTAFVSPLI
ncbi:MAG: Uncharacterized protein FD144_4762 [Rhodospirillaceae bacterium]|nr:MAG: Uncharacterized protein FD144_4762 [Rhodospirillaceae bacterium]